MAAGHYQIDETAHGQGPTSDDIARRLACQIKEQLPGVIQQLMKSGHDFSARSLQLECSLVAAGHATLGNDRVQVATLSLSSDIASPSPTCSLRQTAGVHGWQNDLVSTNGVRTLPSNHPMDGSDEAQRRPLKRARIQPRNCRNNIQDNASAVIRRNHGGGVALPARKRHSDNLALQPSTFEKFVNGIWESLYSGIRMNPAEVIGQWQAIRSNGQTPLLTDTNHETAVQSGTSVFGRMNVLTRKISQTSKTCRSLEVIVQAYWVQCFDDAVTALANDMPRETAKKSAIAQACLDFSWSEKELRNKMGIWRGYHEIQQAAGWAALVFAGTGLYRFCKYRTAFTEQTFDSLRALRHRVEVAADTLHPHWRTLLAIVGASTQLEYTGHPHDWVVCAPGNVAIPLAPTYHKWDPNFSYKHITDCVLDEEAWDYDPREEVPLSDPAASKCQVCGEHQSDDPRQNSCNCYPNLYGCSRANPVPLQIFRTPNGKNNGLLACCPIEKGWAVGEFVGQITSGLKGLDVMVGQNGNTLYQIWQGKQGNHTRFVNHSCKANSQFERFVWLGKQRVVLASLGIKADEEVTVDYGDTYWNDLDKECKCGHEYCRYKDRSGTIEAPPTR